ncbi:MAG: hypothetical protein ACP5RO_02655 [Fervidicoccaceae archaeon]
MKISGIFLTVNERIYLYHYSILRKTIVIYEYNCLKSLPPLWYIIDKIREIEIEANLLKEVASKYKPSLIFFITCKGSDFREIKKAIEAVDDIGADIGAAIHFSDFIKDIESLPKIQYLALYMYASEIEEGNTFREALEKFFMNSTRFIEFHVGVKSREDLLRAMNLIDSFTVTSPLHIFIEKPISPRIKQIESKLSNIYLHDLSTGSSDIYETRCPKCNSLLVIRNGMLPIKGKVIFSSICPKCGEQVLFRESEKKWVNVNLLMRGFDITFPGVQTGHE